MRYGVSMRRLLLPAVFGFIAAGSGTDFAAERSWFGTWVLNRAESHLVGPSITIALAPGGYRFDFGAVVFTVGSDGRDYATVSGRTTSLRQTGPREWFRVHKQNGREVDHSTLTVTADGSAMLIHTVATGPDGTTATHDERLDRVGTRGAGLEGTWRSTAAGVNVSRVMVWSDGGGGRIRREFPEEGQFSVGLPDGSVVPYGGPRAVPGVTVELRASSPSEMRWTEFVDAKPYTEGVDVLSAEGSRMTETSWPVARPADRQEAVYERK